ncbi:MAG: hypothetical protein J6S40_03895 [Thermoguttaceae bacterium]|nr:hypothetical protein [Thermoguttaceae bacterium]
MDIPKSIILTLCAAFLLGGGCALTQKNEPKEDAVHAAFEAQRSQESQMSAFAASAGKKRGSESEKPAGTGEMFLLSDKAKEIYANTER